jgi:CRISPR-associated protein Cst2
MAYLTALLLIDAPASALNNSDEVLPADRYENSSSVKFIRKQGGGTYPYSTAQAYRRWLRDSIDKDPQGWQSSPLYREEKIAYVDANPLRYWDDDLLGYMRAPGKAKKGGKDETGLTPIGDDVSALTRISPLRVSTFVALSPVKLTEDFGVMSRHEGNPILHAHNFYRATLQGLLSLDMSRAGVFTYSQRTGYQNLDSIRKKEADDKGLEHDSDAKEYRLPTAERIQRLRRLIEALPLVQGGAKQTLHYTDVNPVVSIAAVTRYGNHPFNYLFEEKGDEINFKADAFVDIVRAYREQFLSPIYVGWRPGYAVAESKKFQQLPEDVSELLRSGTNGTSIEAFAALASDLANTPNWLD